MKNASKMCSLKKEQFLGFEKNECSKMIHQIYLFLCQELPKGLNAVEQDKVKELQLQQGKQKWWNSTYHNEELDWEFQCLMQYKEWRQQFEDFGTPKNKEFVDPFIQFVRI